MEFNNVPEPVIQNPWSQVQAFIEQRDSAALVEVLDKLSSGEVARVFTRLDEEDCQELLALLEPEDAADLIEELVDAQGADIIEDLPVGQAAEIVDEMESDYRADLLGEMDEEDVEAILQQMDPEEALDARKLLEYEDDTAGGIMVTDFVVYSMDTMVGEVISDMRENAERYSDYGVQYAYVESRNGVLIGVLRLRDLLLSPAHCPVQDIMIVNPLYFLADTPLEDLNQFFDRYTFWSVPVTNAEGQMLGVVRRADVEEAAGEEQGRSFLRFSGIVGGEELRSMALSERIYGRLSWLLVNLTLSLVAASVILFFQGTIDQVFALVFFIPIICNMCGCGGNQAIAVSIRELTLGVVNPDDVFRVWQKEVTLGLVTGTLLGVILGGVAQCVDAIWFHSSPYIGLVIGLAFLTNSLVSVSLGGLIPLFLRKLNRDPALGASPILTTLTDMCGLFFLLSLAQLALYFGLI